MPAIYCNPCGQFREVQCLNCGSQALTNQAEKRLKTLERRIANPSLHEQELVTEIQNLTVSLSLKETEQAELQAQIRALTHQLAEQEDNQPIHQQIAKLAKQLSLVKQQLVRWTQLLSHD